MEDKKILIVDDDLMCRKAISNFAKKHGIESDVVGSGKEAIDSVKSNPSSHFLIMIDLYMPDMNGYETAVELQKVAQGSLGKLVVMSGDELNKEDYEKHGFTYYLQKPVNKKAFEKLMTELNL